MQALLIRELKNDVSESSSEVCVLRLVSLLREIGGYEDAKGVLTKVSDKRGFIWTVNVRPLVKKLKFDMKSNLSNAPHPELILFRKMIEDEERLKDEEERLKAEEERLKAEEEKVKAQKVRN